MTPEQSRDFLRRHLSEERASDDDLEALAERLGYQSLALKMAGQYFEQGFCPSVAEYEEKLDDAWNLSAMASWREKLSDPTAQELSCMAAFGLNWQQVEDETTRQVFLLAGYCMPHQPIPCRALDPAAKFRAKAPDAAINTLVGLGLLVTGDPKAGPIIHPSLAEYARAQEGADALLPYLTRSLDNLAYEFGERADTDLGPLLPHMRLVASRAAENGLGKAASLYGHLGAYSIRTGDYDGAREAYEWALKLEEQAGERDLGDMANYAKMRAVALRFLGNVEGVRAGFERAAALQSEWHAKLHGDPDHIYVGEIHRDAGKVLEAMGDLEGARTAFERALPIYERFLKLRDPRGTNHPVMSALVHKLAGLHRALGDLDRAKAAYERALEIDTVTYGLEHEYVAADAGGLGQVLQAQGDLKGAQAAFEQAVQVSELAHGADHPKTAVYVSWYAHLFKEMDEFYTAYTLYRRALAIFKASLPPGDQSIEVTQKNLEDVQQTLRDKGKQSQEE